MLISTRWPASLHLRAIPFETTGDCMNSDNARFDAMIDFQRAGFWRRSLATLLDLVIVSLPFQVVAAALFAATAGMLQSAGGLYKVCAVTKDIPHSLAPAPPHGSNFARICRASVFGATTGASLTVGRTTREGATTTTVAQRYMLDKAGNPIKGFSIDWIGELAMVFYLVLLESRTGQTLGDRVLGIRVVDAAEPSVSGVPARKVVIRYLAMAIGLAPMLAVLIRAYAISGGDADTFASGNYFLWFAFAGGFTFLWNSLLILQVVLKRDPLYDRLAGTAVIWD
jgi:uncharacterized RDD family membrane protein YckC